MPRKHNIYCGTESKLPSGYKKMGTSAQCTKMRQIRKYGTELVDKEQYETHKQTKKENRALVRKMKNEIGKLEVKKSALEKEKGEISKKKKPTTKDKKRLKMIDSTYKNITQKQADLRAEFIKKGSGQGEVWRGGKISTKLLKELFEKNDFKDVPPYILDKSLSTEWVRVLHDPKSKHTINPLINISNAILRICFP